ncbi:MAG: 4Fe-4S single cluster domain-containing protein [Hyphomicrobiaceae bacterium]
MRIGISRIHFPITTLGPGRRLGIWFQGCSIRCPGCISADTWGSGRGLLELDELLEQVEGWLPECDGITISGGEPFDQCDALNELLRGLRAKVGVDILVYSGHPFERLAEPLRRMNGFIDALISEPYLAHAPETLPLRGSDNQRLHMLTDLGRERFSAFEHPDQCKQTFDVMFDDDGAVWLAGIPRRGDFERLKVRLSQLGHRIVTSEDASSPLCGADQA